MSSPSALSRLRLHLRLHPAWRYLFVALLAGLVLTWCQNLAAADERPLFLSGNT